MILSKSVALSNGENKELLVYYMNGDTEISVMITDKDKNERIKYDLSGYEIKALIMILEDLNYQVEEIMNK